MILVPPDYTYYTDTYLGNQITEHDFPRLIKRAGDYLLKFSCSGADENSLSMAACAVAEAWQTNEQGGDVVSQSVGSWSKAYAQQKPISNDKRLLDAAKLYLGACAVSVRWA